MVAQNPANLGIGIDENTAVVVDRTKEFTVIGEGAVYVIDGTHITIHDVKLHILGEGDIFDLEERRPVVKEQQKAH